MEMKNRLLKSLILGVVVMGLAWACQPPDELPIIPKISYNRVEFFDQIHLFSISILKMETAI